VVVANISRLARDAASLMNLKNAGIDFIAPDMPEANRLPIGIMAFLTETERKAISIRAYAALVAAKARGANKWAHIVMEYS
jgi:DNA invertase Pin-like site-specific DNA recombinase